MKTNFRNMFLSVAGVALIAVVLSFALKKEEPHDHSSHATVTDSLNFPVESGTLDWCREHAVPESGCTRCNPALIEQFKANGDWCVEHDLPESQCRLCNPRLQFPQELALQAELRSQRRDDITISLFFRPNRDICATNDAIIQFATAETAERAGLTVQTVRETKRVIAFEAPAEVVFDETESRVITTTVPATVTRWMVSPGDIVSAGQILALLSSPEIAFLQGEYLSRRAALEAEAKEFGRFEELKLRALISDGEFERAQAEFEKVRAEYLAARGLLLAAGIADDDIDNLTGSEAISNQFALRAPSSGIMVERIAQHGDLVEPGRPFALLANPSAVWIEARLTEEQLRTVRVGQDLTFSSDGRGIKHVGARIIWVSNYLDPETRTGKVRARVKDADMPLRAGEFGTASIIQAGEENVVLVPKDAVQWEGCCNVVFVKEAVDRYRPRKVNPMEAEGPFYQLSGGVEPGDEVVVDGAFLLKTELKKSSIGAGCCGLEPTS